MLKPLQGCHVLRQKKEEKRQKNTEKYKKYRGARLATVDPGRFDVSV